MEKMRVAEAHGLLLEMHESFRCPICRRSVSAEGGTPARPSACLHFFCGPCLDAAERASRGPAGQPFRDFRCPICRVRVPNRRAVVKTPVLIPVAKQLLRLIATFNRELAQASALPPAPDLFIADSQLPALSPAKPPAPKRPRPTPPLAQPTLTEEVLPPLEPLQASDTSDDAVGLGLLSDEPPLKADAETETKATEARDAETETVSRETRDAEVATLPAPPPTLKRDADTSTARAEMASRETETEEAETRDAEAEARPSDEEELERGLALLRRHLGEHDQLAGGPRARLESLAPWLLRLVQPPSALVEAEQQTSQPIPEVSDPVVADEPKESLTDSLINALSLGETPPQVKAADDRPAELRPLPVGQSTPLVPVKESLSDSMINGLSLDDLTGQGKDSAKQPCEQVEKKEEAEGEALGREPSEVLVPETMEPEGEAVLPVEESPEILEESVLPEDRKLSLCWSGFSRVPGSRGVKRLMKSVAEAAEGDWSLGPLTEQTTHLVVHAEKGEKGLVGERTLKFCQAVARGLWVVGAGWLEARQAGEAAEAEWEVAGDASSGVNDGPRRSREAGGGLLRGWTVAFRGAFEVPSRAEVEALAESAGAEVVGPADLGQDEGQPKALILAPSGDHPEASQPHPTIPVLTLAWLHCSLAQYTVLPFSDFTPTE